MMDRMITVRASSLTVLLVSLLAAWIYAEHSYDGELKRDDSVIVYSRQQMAEGVPPYVSIFQPNGPISPWIAGFAVRLGGSLQVEDVLAARYTINADVACLVLDLLRQAADVS